MPRECSVTERSLEQSQLMLRTFNGDCDATVARTKFSNVGKLEKRIQKAFDSTNKLGATKKIAITQTRDEQ